MIKLPSLPVSVAHDSKDGLNGILRQCRVVRGLWVLVVARALPFPALECSRGVCYFMPLYIRFCTNDDLCGWALQQLQLRPIASSSGRGPTTRLQRTAPASMAQNPH